MTKMIVFATVAMIAAAGLAGIVGCGSNTAAESSTQGPKDVVTDETLSEKPVKTGAGMAAVEKAAEAEKYLFALFRKEEDGDTAAMRSVLQEVIKEVADRADSVEVNVSTASERSIVDKFGLDRAPMPLILAIAPNGAITGGFPTKAEKQELLDAFASPSMEKCMKPLQENKLVLLCVQNAATESNDAALKGVGEFKADARFAEATEIVMLDPTDVAEAAFLKDLRIDPKIEAAVTVFLAPPGMPIGMYKGATSKDEIVATLEKSSSACGPGGCGPGGCGPAGCPPE